MTRTTMGFGLLAAAFLAPTTPADAAIQFPLDVMATECFQYGGGTGVCMGTGYRMFSDGTMRGMGGESGTWAFFSGNFMMTLTADWDGDGRWDYRHDYLGAPVRNCVEGDVYDWQTDLVGDFSLCP